MFRSDRLGLRGEMELLHFQGRSQRRAAALAFRTADTFGRTDHLNVPGSEQFQNALVETKVANRILNLPILDVTKRRRASSPVNSAVRGSTLRIYQKRLTNKPRSMALNHPSTLVGGAELSTMVFTGPGVGSLPFSLAQ